MTSHNNCSTTEIKYFKGDDGESIEGATYCDISRNNWIPHS